MTQPAGWAAAAAAMALLLGLLLVLAGLWLRRSRGLGGGKTVSLDPVTLSSYRLGLTGRLDRLIKAGGAIIVEEWKSAHVLRPWHRAQIGVYLLLDFDSYITTTSIIGWKTPVFHTGPKT
jgi:hypothetical protein